MNKKNNFETVHLKKIKINIENNSFWVAPNIFNLFSPKRTNFYVKKAKSFQQIWEQEKLNVGNYYISLNRDLDFKVFNEIQKYSYLDNLKIDNQMIKQIEKNGKWIYKLNEYIELEFDEKVIYKIYKGNSFLINENYFEDYVEILKNKKNIREVYTFKWNGSKFELI